MPAEAASAALHRRGAQVSWWCGASGRLLARSSSDPVDAAQCMVGCMQASAGPAAWARRPARLGAVWGVLPA